jgi:hypothetical protein
MTDMQQSIEWIEGEPEKQFKALIFSEIDRLFPAKSFQLARDLASAVTIKDYLLCLTWALSTQIGNLLRELNEERQTTINLNAEYLISLESLARLIEGITDDHLNHHIKNSRLEHIAQAMRSAKTKLMRSVSDNAAYIAYIKELDDSASRF